MLLAAVVLCILVVDDLYIIQLQLIKRKKKRKKKEGRRRREKRKKRSQVGSERKEIVKPLPLRKFFLKYNYINNLGFTNIFRSPTHPELRKTFSKKDFTHKQTGP
jgi:hypothetical protein